MKKCNFSGFNSQRGEIEACLFAFGENSFDKVLTPFTSPLYYNLREGKATFSCLNSDVTRIDQFEQEVVVSVNTDSVWKFNSTNNELMQLVYPFEKPFECIKVDRSLNSNNILVAATDVNVYLLCRLTGMCVYQLKENVDKHSAKIDESPVLAIPVNKRFFTESIKKIASGREHVLILTEPSGLVYSFGIGTKGQLGHGEINNCYEPKLVENFSEISDIFCGGWHSGLIDKHGDVYMWGWNSSGQLGICEEDEDEDESTIVSRPVMINTFHDSQIKIKKLSLGSRHSLMLDMNNNAYGCGWNKYKQLLLDCTQAGTPELIEKYENRVLDIKSGPWYSLILTDE